VANFLFTTINYISNINYVLLNLGWFSTKISYDHFQYFRGYCKL